MKIAILSDVHENSHNLILALKTIEEKECEQILFLGDFMNNGIAKFFASFKIPTFAVWGNNDGERAMTSPGAKPVIWLAGTRESEQPIHR